MARPSSTERAKRLIALLSHLEADTRTPLSELAGRLGVSRAQAAEDLTTLSFCGVAPYDPFGLVPVLVDGEDVIVFGEVPALRGPVRLSANEAEALAAALQAAGFSADDPLTRKVLEATTSSYLAEDVERLVRTQVGGHDTEVYEQLARAVTDRQAAEIEHASAGTTEIRCRIVEPAALFAERGAWYLAAWCRQAGDWRTFRLDRVLTVRPTGERVDAERLAALPDNLPALDPSGLPVARLRFTSAETFSEREWPGSRVVDASDDGVVVEVPYAGTAWVARHVVGCLGAVEVLEPEEMRTAVREIAEEELRRLG